MLCVHCDADNPQQAKFCYKCGAALSIFPNAASIGAALRPPNASTQVAADEEQVAVPAPATGPSEARIPAKSAEERPSATATPSLTPTSPQTGHAAVPESKPKKQSVWWPKVDTVEAARSAAKDAAGICFFIAGGTALISVIAMGIGHPVFGVTGWDWIGAAIFAIAGWAMTQMSRIWSTVSLLFYVVIRGIALFNLTALQPGDQNDQGSVSSLLIWSFIFGMALLNGIRGTFAYHRLTRSPQSKPTAA
jgi:hypothetical protein